MVAAIGHHGAKRVEADRFIPVVPNFVDLHCLFLKIHLPRAPRDLRDQLQSGAEYMEFVGEAWLIENTASSTLCPMGLGRISS